MLFHGASDLRNNLAQPGIISLIAILKNALERELNCLPHFNIYILTGWYYGTEHSCVCWLPDNIPESASAEQSSWCIFTDTSDCWDEVTLGQGAATNRIGSSCGLWVSLLPVMHICTLHLLWESAPSDLREATDRVFGPGEPTVVSSNLAHSIVLWFCSGKRACIFESWSRSCQSWRKSCSELLLCWTWTKTAIKHIKKLVLKWKKKNLIPVV